MEQEMSVIMIGNQDSGKTTSMASSYGLMKEGRFGFYVRADTDTDEVLNRLYKDIQKGIYPMPTDKRNKYTFTLHYYEKRVLSFEWIDYYGGVITEQKSEKLQSDMDKADAIMLFVEAEALLYNDKKKSQLRRLLYMVAQKLINDKEGQVFNIVIVLTKYDRIGTSVPFEKVCEPLKQFCESVEGKENIEYRIVPVSCTQYGFVNAELPLMDILCCGLYKKYDRSYDASRKTLSQAVDYERKSGFFDWAVSKLVREKTYGQLAKEKYKEALEQYNLAAEIMDAGQKLAQYAADYKIVIPEKGGKKQTEKPKRRARFSSL